MELLIYCEARMPTINKPNESHEDGKEVFLCLYLIVKLFYRIILMVKVYSCGVMELLVIFMSSAYRIRPRSKKLRLD
jgi:hypothetical protein